MVNAALPLQAGVMERVAGRYPRTLRSAIPLAADVEYMGVHRMPLPVYAPDCPAALAYQALWGEVLARG